MPLGAGRGHQAEAAGGADAAGATRYRNTATLGNLLHEVNNNLQMTGFDADFPRVANLVNDIGKKASIRGCSQRMRPRVPAKRARGAATAAAEVSNSSTVWGARLLYLKLSMSYQAAIDQLNAMAPELYTRPGQPRRKFSLDEIRVLLAALGNPQRRFRSVLIAGTNGKGSTASTLSFDSDRLRDARRPLHFAAPGAGERAHPHRRCGDRRRCLCRPLLPGS